MREGNVLGTGIDLVENERMDDMLRRRGAKFRDRVFLKGEQDYCETKAAPSRHYAARFAVKEAVSKAFGTGIGPHLGWLDIEVVRDSCTGAPAVELSRRAKVLADAHRVADILVSLSHTRHYAVAHALVIGRNA